MRAGAPGGVRKLASISMLAALVASTAVPGGATTPHIHMMIMQVSAEQQMLRVAVMLKAPKSLRQLDDGTSAGDQAYAKANRALQDEVIRSVFGMTAWQLGAEGRSIEQFEFIPAFSLKATEEEIRKLRADRRVKSVNYTTFMRPNKLLH